jgi:hypothetical protein
MFLKIKICRTSINKNFKSYFLHTCEVFAIATVLALFQISHQELVLLFFCGNLHCFGSKSFLILCRSAFCASRQNIIFSSCCTTLFSAFYFIEYALALANYGQRAAFASFVRNTHKPRENTNILSFISCVYFACVNPIRSVTHPHHVGGNTSNKILHITPLLAQRFNRQDN